MSKENGLLFKDRIATTTTVYVEVPVRAGTLGAFVSWPDTTSSATITVELTSNRSASADASADKWKDSGSSFTGPGGTAVGSLLINMENVRQKRARIKIVTAAVTYLEVWDGTGDGFAA